MSQNVILDILEKHRTLMSVCADLAHNARIPDGASDADATSLLHKMATKHGLRLGDATARVSRPRRSDPRKPVYSVTMPNDRAVSRGADNQLPMIACVTIPVGGHDFIFCWVVREKKKKSGAYVTTLEQFAPVQA